MHFRLVELLRGGSCHRSGSVVSAKPVECLELLPAMYVTAESFSLVIGLDCSAANALVLRSDVRGEPVQQPQKGLRVFIKLPVLFLTFQVRSGCGHASVFVCECLFQQNELNN
jgi:hypothetical protein